MAAVSSFVGDRPAVLVDELPTVEAGGKMAVACSLVGDRPAIDVGKFPAVEAGGKMAGVGRDRKSVV